ncbi:MAG TPA: zinc ribbon domain-containing protein [Massilibacterium sp.]|nr:zinc ribbon domain-containing protein [Massilibacterium sp.]
MPIYVYKTDSGRIFEKFQHMSDEPLHQCPETGETCHRVITGGHGALLPAEKNVKYKDGNFINSKMAKVLEKNPLTTTLSDKAKKIKENSDKARQHNAEMRRKITGRITEL